MSPSQNWISLVSDEVQVDIYTSRIDFTEISHVAKCLLDSSTFCGRCPQTPTIHTFQTHFFLPYLPLLHIPILGNHHHITSPPNVQATQTENFGDILGFSFVLIPLPPESISIVRHFHSTLLKFPQVLYNHS